MKKFLLASAAAGSFLLAAAPAGAAALLPGTSDILFTDFAPIAAATQGSQLAVMSSPGSAGTFAGTLRSAVYQNSLGTLDFYYQVRHDGGQPIDSLTFSSFGNFLVDAFYWDADPDGGGIFDVEGNGGLTAAQSTAERSNSGEVLRTVFSFPATTTTPATQDPVGTGETSATYIFRTNSTVFGTGTASVQDGVAFFVPAFAPVPEPATWAMMLLGFGAVGYSMRRRPRYRMIQAV